MTTESKRPVYLRCSYHSADGESGSIFWFSRANALFPCSVIDRGSEASEINRCSIRESRERFKTGDLFSTISFDRSMERPWTVDVRLTLLTLIKRGVNAAWITILMDSLN